MAAIHRRTRTIDAAGGTTIDADSILASDGPVILKGHAADWPLVAAGRRSADDAVAYLRGFDAGRTITGYTVPPGAGGRFFYDADLKGMNFVRERTTMEAYLARIRIRASDGAADAPALYIGSTDLAEHLPGLSAENPCPLAGATLDAHPPMASIWVGNRTIASAHWDMSNNIAVCAVGHRRFTLFPPDQAANLYPGPLEPTPGGQVVSMVDFTAPDPVRHPRFEQAAAAGEVADLEPGDVLVYPALWWHQVEAIDPFNILVNYWWNDAPSFADTPMTTLLHGFLSLRDRPLAEKQAWRTLFDHYIFGPADAAGAHLPDHARGLLGPLDDIGARRLRAQVLQRLNR